MYFNTYFICFHTNHFFFNCRSNFLSQYSQKIMKLHIFFKNYIVSIFWDVLYFTFSALSFFWFVFFFFFVVVVFWFCFVFCFLFFCCCCFFFCFFFGGGVFFFFFLGGGLFDCCFFIPVQILTFRP